MRCKACDKPVKGPIKVQDKETNEVYDEWLCGKCNHLSYAHEDSDDGVELAKWYIELEGSISVEDLAYSPFDDEE